MIWIALLMALGSTINGAIVRMTVREWMVQSGLLVISILASLLITWHIWPQLQPLKWFDALFEPPTRWLYNIL